MKLLLDTHILLWALTGDKKLPEEADKMINSADNVIFYSIIISVGNCDKTYATSRTACSNSA